MKFNAFRSRWSGSSRRHFGGTTRSISCVNAPNAHIRPQYKRPHNTVATTVKTARKYQARLYLKIGRFQSSRAKTFTIEMSWLFMKPRYTTATANVTYFSVVLFRKKLTRARAVNALNPTRSSA